MKQKSLRIRILWLLITSPLIAANNAVNSLFQKHLWDALPMKQTEALSWGMLFIAYLFFFWAAAGLNTINQVFFSKETGCRIKEQVYSGYIKSKAFLYERKNLESTINHDIPMLEEDFYYAAVHCLIYGLDVLFAFIITFSVNIFYGLFCFIVMIIPVLLSIRQVDRISEIRQKLLDEKEGYTGFLSEMRRGKETVRLYQLLEVIFGRHNIFVTQIAELGSKKREQMAANVVSSQNINRLASGIAAFGGFYLVSQGKLTLGWVMAFLQLSSSMTYSLVDTIQTGINILSCRKVRNKLYHEYHLSEKSALSVQQNKKDVKEEKNNGIASAEQKKRYLEISQISEKDRKTEKVEQRKKAEGKIGCHCYVKSCYLGKRQILEEIDFFLAPGEKLLIAGKNGSGKTTLLKILLGLNENFEGFVEWSDEKKQILEKEEVSNQIAYIPQDPFIFDGTVKENILLDREEEEEFYQEIKKKVCLKLEDGKRVSDLEQTISGGEKQKIELARALYSKRGVLILDEPYSALDQSSFLKAEEYLLTDPAKTVIVVSHVEREETRSLYSRRLILEDGKVSAFCM